jgi:hypothetical protein
MFTFPVILGCIAALLLLAGFVSAGKLLSGPAAQRRDRSLATSPAAERSSMLLIGSLVLSLVAAGFAVVLHFVT